jgi:hypothetical protein
LLAGAVGVAAFVWSGEAYTPVVLTDDSLRDQLLARDCTDLGRCHLIGPPASLHPLYHGAEWIDLLVAVRLLGSDALHCRVALAAAVDRASRRGSLFVRN